MSYKSALKEAKWGERSLYDLFLKNPNVEIEDVQALIDTYPHAVKKESGFGYPLHLAVEKGISYNVIKLLIDENRDALKEKGMYGRLPLHIALKEGASMEVIKLLVGKYPDAAKEAEREKSALPLHIAVECGASVEVIQLLVGKNSDAVKERDVDRCLPLHIAVAKGASMEVIQLLIQGYPDAVNKTDKYGRLPLHNAVVVKCASVEVIKLLIEKYPDAVEKKDKNGNLPLHAAIQCGASVEVSAEVVRLLIEKYPDAVNKTDKYGRLPLHTAVVVKCASVEVVQLLIEKYPDAVEKKDGDGNLPLHTAIQFGASVGVIKLLIEEYRDAVKEEDKNGNLPLHAAIQCGASVEVSAEVVRLLIEKYPDAVNKTDKYGRLPLHTAVVVKYASVEVVQLLIEIYPDAVKEKDGDGVLPLHRIIKAKMNAPSRLQVIFNAHPQAAKERMKDGRLPIEVYLKNKDAGDSVLVLLKADMPVDLKGGTQVEHFGSWTTCVSSGTIAATAAVRQVLSNDEGGAGFGRHIHALADVRDAEGRTALGAASAGARTEIYKYLLFCGRYKLYFGPPEHRTGSSTLFRAQEFDEKANYGIFFDKADKNGDGNLDKKKLKSIAESIGLDPDLFLKGSDKNTISKAEFIATCKRQLGDGPREVVIKFMQNKDHWDRETKARDDFKLIPKYVVSALSNIPEETSNIPEDTEIAEAVVRGDGGLDTIVENFLDGIKPGKYAIIMNAAERNLHQILFQEQPKIEAVRDMLRQVFEAVQHLHDQGLMHGDLKMVNIVRFRIDNKLRLIDLDASARIAQRGEEEEAFAGAKSSSAILPPEMIERIVKKEKLDKFDEYWKAENDEDLYEKVKPKPYKERGLLKAHYVVKSFRTKDGQPVHNDLPYDLVHASSSIDAWSLGVLAFTLLTGETLIPSTFVDDCASGAAMHVLYSWGTQPEVLSELYKKIPNDAARDLVSQLLQKDPAKRPTVKHLLENHPFFHPDRNDQVMQNYIREMKDRLDNVNKTLERQAEQLEIMNANILVIKMLGDESKAELFFTRSLLLKAIFEATEISTPTSFIVLNEKLLQAADSSDEEAKQKILDIVTAEDGSGVRMNTKYASATVTAEGADFHLEGDLKEHYEQVQVGIKWARCIKYIGLKIASGEAGKALDIIKDGIRISDLIVGEEMYLYLIDELTGKPVQADGWPLVITTPSELVPKLLPLMMVGMRAMCICNGLAGLARMFGYPVPKVPEAVSKGAQDSVELLKQESSVQEFVVVHEEVKRGTEEKKSVRGASLREFVDFLKKNDPGLKDGKSGDFAGLHRIGDPNDGTALWTALTDPKDIEKALKERAEERKAEQRKQDENVREIAQKEVESAPGSEGNDCCAMM